MDRWIDLSIDRLIVGLMDGWMDGLMNLWIDRCIDGWIDGSMDILMDQSMDGWMDGGRDCGAFYEGDTDQSMGSVVILGVVEGGREGKVGGSQRCDRVCRGV